MSIFRLLFLSVSKSEICKICLLTICKVILFAKSILTWQNYEISAKVLIYEPWFIVLLIQHKIYGLIVCNMAIFWKLQSCTFLDPHLRSPKQQNCSSSGQILDSLDVGIEKVLIKLAGKCVKISAQSALPCLVVHEMNVQFKENCKCYHDSRT